MRIMAIDYGDAHTGVAISDPTGFLAGVTTTYVNDSLSVASPSYTEFPRFYLNDHNEPRSYDDIGLRKEDFEMFGKMGIR